MMKLTHQFSQRSALCALLALGAPTLANADSSFERGQEAILGQAGCHIVDYSYTETESLKEGYQIDGRVYDSNKDKTTYELIIPIQKSATEIRLQHVLFMKDLKTGEVKGIMKHHSEDWAFEASHHFEFVTAGQYTAVPNTERSSWTRKTTNLDDGLRYQCEGQWDFTKHHPEFNCSTFAPIPGREIRDMARKDYNTLDRTNRVITYDHSWIERQDNIKTIQAENGDRTPLAREHGRIWYVKQNDEQCAEAKTWALSRMAYWKVLMETWEEYLSENKDWKEVGKIDGLPRFVAMFAVEEKYADALRTQPELATEAKAEIRAIIEKYRR